MACCVTWSAGRSRPKRQITDRDFALRRDGELCVHDGVSQIGVFDASESEKPTRHARRVGYIDLHNRYKRMVR